MEFQDVPELTTTLQKLMINRVQGWEKVQRTVISDFHPENTQIDTELTDDFFIYYLDIHCYNLSAFPQ